jgi:hypothetical protein
VGTTGEPVADFVAALRAADAALVGVRDRVAAARVHENAFGKLFEAQAVRNTYHERLPTMARDFDEARAVLTHFIAGLSGGHRIVTTRVPAQPGGSES